MGSTGKKIKDYLLGRPLVRFLASEVAPRWKKVLLSPHAMTSIALVVWALLNRNLIRGLEIDMSKVGGALGTYAAIAIGFGVSALAIVIAVPSRNLAIRLSKKGEDGRSSYGDLTVVYTWSSVVHWLLLILTMVMGLAADPAKVAKYYPLWKNVVEVAGVLTIGLGWYCVCQFLVCVVTSHQFATVYIGSMSKEQPTIEASASNVTEAISRSATRRF